MEAAQSAESTSNDLEMTKKKEDEHLRLQRQFRIIQTDRINRTSGVHPQFRRQDLLLRTLKKEYLSLAKDLKIASTGAHKKNNKRMKAELKRTLLLRMKTEQEAESGSTMMEQLEGLLQGNHRNMLELQSRVDANAGQIRERQEQSEQRLVATENKLEVANRRFNAVQCENQRIREQIEHMLKDRANFNREWSKMIAALSKGKKFLTDLFESSTVAYDQRDEWCTKLKSMTEKGRMDQMLQVQEMRDLQKAFDHEMKMFHFLAKKGVKRVNKRQERREEERKKREEEEKQKNLDYHLNILQEIEDYTQESNTERIIYTFERFEQEVFSIYKLITEYCAENEVLTREMNRIHQQIADRQDSNEAMETRRQEKLQMLSENLEALKTRNEELRSRLNEKELLINGTMDKIHDIFKMLNLSLEPFQNLLGDKQPSLHQLGLTLCLINDKIKEHVATVYYLERYVLKKEKSSTSRLKKYTVHADPRDYFTALPINLLVPADPCPACTEARWLSRVTDSLEAPLARSGAVAAVHSLNAEPAYERSDRIHPLADCRLPASRIVLAKRYM